MVSFVNLAVKYEWGRKPDKTFRKSEESYAFSLASYTLSPVVSSVNQKLNFAGSHLKDVERNGRNVSSRLK